MPSQLAPLKQNLLGIASETYSCAATPVQLAATVAYDVHLPGMNDFLDGQRRILGALGRWCASQLQQVGLAVAEPEGGFYLYVDFSPMADGLHRAGISTSDDLCLRLMADTGVALLPGSAFGMPMDHLSARLAYVDFDGSAALKAEAVRAQGPDRDFMIRYCPGQIQGIEQLAEWVAELAK